jgi:hypothetical protein
LPAVHEFQAEPEPTSLESECQEYTKEAFVEAILEFIVGDDQVCLIPSIEHVVILTLLQAINIVESPRLKKIFLLLCEELQESDIPGCSTMHTHIEKAYEEHLKQLEEEMVVN